MNNFSSLYKTKVIQGRENRFGSNKRLHDPLATIHGYSRDADKILQEIYARIIDTDAPDRDFCLVALGGYGRRELWPYSDIDLLILHENKHPSAKLTAFVRILWNTGFTLGCVVRTITECATIIGDDLATDTAMLESRYVCGNRDLFNRLQNKCVRPYFEKNKKTYLGEISASLREGLYSSENSLYRIEPDLKNGICTLRDCQRLLWAERMHSGASKIAELHTKSGFSQTETKRFAANYSFLAGLRTELHLICGMRIDVLETGLQKEIAGRYGFPQNDAGALMEKFFKTVRNIRWSLLSFLEKDLSGKSIWHGVRRRVSALDIAPGIGFLDGIIFPLHKKSISLETGYKIVRLFQSALTYQATLSVELLNRIRKAVETVNSDDFKSKTVDDLFLSILAWPGAIGQTLLAMQETGLLGKLLPPFDALTCKVEYDQYHEFTLDQHILLAVCACDEMTDDQDKKIRTISRSIKDKLILRLAVLLHDIGKVQEGEHAQNGAVIAENICQRLGLTEAQTEQIRFLVYHHLDMSNLSLLREPDSNNIGRFAGEVATIDMLDMLYILTVADIRSVGPNTWTGWKAYQLEQLYDRVRQSLQHPGTAFEIALPRTEALIPDPSYLHDTMPEDSIKHRAWLSEIAVGGFQLHSESFTGFERLTVCSYDRVGFLTDIIGCLSSEGYNILSARIYSTDAGQVLDIFHLEPPERPRLTVQKRISNIYRKWELINDGRTTAEELAGERIALYPPSTLRLGQPAEKVDIKVNNRDSQMNTIIEIDTADNFGLLHKITRCFHENDVNVVSARLSTRNDRAVDVFYVTDLHKRKITGRSCIDRLVNNLTVALQSK
ncbi:MAG: HD domain-containing protein [Smithellaceae bacterium]